ncbi:hypothetical protein JYT61_00905 [bacterium AH-315-E10]|nr:hypothetical protein [bacterium AH-315-E10]
MADKYNPQEKSSMDLLEETVHLLRHAPLSAVAIYFIGTIPFVTMLLYFCYDMSNNPFAKEHIVISTLMLALLFIWMKSLHSIFASHLLAFKCNDSPPPLTLRSILKRCKSQAFFQAIAIPANLIALVIVIPFAWCHAYFQNITVLDNDDISITQLHNQSQQQAKLWPKQNHFVIWVFSPWLLFFATSTSVLLSLAMKEAMPYQLLNLGIVLFLIYFMFFIILSPLGIVLSVSIAVSIFVLPYFMKLFLDMDTQLYTSAASTVISPMFIVIVSIICYMIMDPLIRTAYVLRCYYGLSLTTGRDLLVDLKHIKQKQLLSRQTSIIALSAIIFLSTATSNVRADTNTTPSPSPKIEHKELNDAIEDTLKQRKYNWRLPTDFLDLNDELAELSWFETQIEKFVNFLKIIKKWVVKLANFIEQLFPSSSSNVDGSEGSGSFWQKLLKVAAAILLIVAIILIIYILIKYLKRRKQLIVTPASGVAVPVKIDLEDEHIDAQQLPENEWLELAAEMLKKGELRLALRALYLATLVHLGAENLIRIKKFKTNSDYVTELRLHQHSIPELIAKFTHTVNSVDSIWYGDHIATQDIFDDCQNNLNDIRNAERGA